MTDDNSLYDVLGVDRDAEPAEINAAYRKKAKDEHPDRGGDKNRFALVARAGMILRDPDKRAEYDRTGKSEPEPDRERASVLKFVVAAFGEAVDACSSPEFTDIVVAMRCWLDGRKEIGNAKVAEIQEDIDKITTIVSRLSYTGDGDNVLVTMSETRLVDLRRAADDLEKQLAHLEGAHRIAADYVYRLDERPKAEDTVAAWAAANRSIFETGDLDAIAREFGGIIPTTGAGRPRKPPFFKVGG